MRPEQRDSAHLWDMQDAARGTLRILGGMDLAQFLLPDQERTRLAVERTLEILGEAARRVSQAFRGAHPEIPWKDLIGLRNVISHEYDKVDYEVIHGIIWNRIPDLLRRLEPLVPPPPQDEG
jgi:uncharacterized protein with HEPN domain